MNSVKAKLMLCVISGMSIILIGALVTLFLVKNVAAELDSLINNELSTRQQVGLISSQFKTQVQEWKNVLIRGSEPEQYEKYWLRFEKNEQLIQDNIKVLLDTHTLPDSIIHQLASFQKEHQKLGVLYRVGLNEYSASLFNTQIGDKAVKGIDRLSAKLLGDINVAITHLVSDRSVALTAKKEQVLFQSMVMMFILSSVILLLMTLFIQRLITHPIRQASSIAEQIASGNLANDIHGHDNDEIGLLLNNLNTMQQNLLAMTDDLKLQMVQQQTQAQENGRIKQALDNAAAPVMLSDGNGKIIYSNHQCERLFLRYKDQIKATQPNVTSLNEANVEHFFDQQSCYGTLREAHRHQVECEVNYQSVIFNVVAGPVFDEEKHLLGIVYELSDLTEQRYAEEQVGKIIQSASQGQLATRLDSTEFTGFMHTLAKSINSLLDAIALPIKQTKDTLNLIATGQVPDAIHGDYSGEFLEINHSLKTATGAINALIADTNMLMEAASQGELSKRADINLHQGDFQSIVKGFNTTLDVIVEPVRLTADYLDLIAKGQLPTDISNSYQGDFLQIKNSLTTSIDAIKSMVKDTTELAQAASKGQLEQRVDASKHQGEFSVIVGGINSTIDAISKPLHECKSVMHALSEGNLTQLVEGEYQGDFNTLKHSVNTSVSNLAKMVSQIRTTANTINGSANGIKLGMNDLSARTESQAASIEQTTASMSDITHTVSINSKDAHSAASLATEADKQAQQGGELVHSTVNAMKEISNSSNEISSIIEVINEIAFQTNLLALNAAVEAARAGESGRGFAVVAAEVRELAQRSANASKEISTLLNDSAMKVDHGVQLVTESGQTLGHIVSSIKQLSQLMENIALASTEQSNGVGQVNVAIKQMDGIIQKNTILVETANSSSNSLSHQANELNRFMSGFEV
ncbi:methyl-accepting chemotaxis protein [Pseudoalteromonas sp. MMG012]|uniref:methyl-accepting chemotaxis protein n=1 Tax=Pseudoalteromonas sp. MMG012 TaxID=2822686 RepID=UPI001B3A403A|nr:methyl-accepting chemotaxis protein [Pseudoalteromonas sp. MMG012]MBQ4848835.1 HAMP domain-containing protein [Pseudoalteromonas sp. MMG012]